MSFDSRLAVFFFRMLRFHQNFTRVPTGLVSHVALGLKPDCSRSGVFVLLWRGIFERPHCYIEFRQLCPLVKGFSTQQLSCGGLTGVH